LQRYLSDVQGQRLEMAGDRGEQSFGDVAAYDGEGGAEDDIDREMLMSQVRIFYSSVVLTATYDNAAGAECKQTCQRIPAHS
jgi:hypothetical protein